MTPTMGLAPSPLRLKLYRTFSVQGPSPVGMSSNTVPVFVGATGLRGAVEIACSIDSQGSKRIFSVGILPEVVQYFLGILSVCGSNQLVRGARGAAAASVCESVNIAGGIQNHACRRERSVRD